MARREAQSNTSAIVERLQNDASNHSGTQWRLYRDRRRLRETLLDHGHRFKMGRYHVLARIGEGGMGIVYRAYDPELARAVALKVVRFDNSVSTLGEDQLPIRQMRMIREARGLAKITHPHIVAIYDVGLADEHELFMAMELIDGHPLHEHIQIFQPSWRQILELYIQAADGLAAAHDAGIIHRDFKPSNIMVGHDRRVRVLDFGIVSLGNDHLSQLSPSDTFEFPATFAHHPDDTDVAAPSAATYDHTFQPQRLHTLLRPSKPPSGSNTDQAPPIPPSTPTKITEAGMNPGTPRYMSPEQSLGQSCDIQSDIFSFCVCLYESLTGRQAFSSENTELRFQQIRAQNLEWPTSCPGALRAAIQKGLAWSAHDRWQDVHELMEVLRAVHQRRPVHQKAALLLGVIGTAAVLSTQSQIPTGIDCDHASQRIHEIWNSQIESEVALAFYAHGSEASTESFDRTKTRISDWIARWKETDRSLCELNLSENSDDDAASDQHFHPDHALIDVCLSQRRAEMNALVSNLQRNLSIMDVLQAPSLALKVPNPTECTNTKAFRVASPLPQDPTLWVTVQELRDELGHAKVLQEQARYDEALDHLETLRNPIQKTGFIALAAEYEFSWASLRQEFHTDSQRAVLHYHRALALGIQSKQRSIAAQAAMALVFERGFRLNEVSARDELLAQAAATVRAAGSPPNFESWLARLRGIMRGVEGNMQQSLPYIERFAALANSLPSEYAWQAVTAADDLSLTRILLGQYEKALHNAYAAIELSRRVYGPSHPRTVLATHRAARAALNLDRIDDAKAQSYRAVSPCVGILPYGHECDEAMKYTVHVLAVAGNYIDALGLALDVSHRTPGQNHQLLTRISGPLATRLAPVLAARGELSAADALIQSTLSDLEHDSQASARTLAEVWMLRASASISLQDFDTANIALAHAADALQRRDLGMDSIMPQYFYLRAQLAYEKQDFNASMEHLQFSAELYRQNHASQLEQSKIHQLAAKIALATGLFDRAQYDAELALRTLQTISAIDPSAYRELRLLLADIFLKQHRPKLALDQLSQIRIEFDPIEVLENRLAPVDFLEAQAWDMIDTGSIHKNEAQYFARSALDRYLDWDRGAEHYISEVRTWLALHASPT